MRLQIVIAAVFGLALTAAGAIGAHLLPERSASWDSALLFGFAHTLAALVVPSRLPASRLANVSAWLFLAGVGLFSLGIIARAMAGASGGDPLSALGPLAPVGGVSYMIGWIVLAAAALAPPKA